MILLEQKAIYNRTLTPLSWLSIPPSYWRERYSPLDGVDRGWTIIPPGIIFWQSTESIRHDGDTDDKSKGMLYFSQTKVVQVLK